MGEDNDDKRGQVVGEDEAPHTHSRPPPPFPSTNVSPPAHLLATTTTLSPTFPLPHVYLLVTMTTISHHQCLPSRMLAHDHHHLPPPTSPLMHAGLQPPPSPPTNVSPPACSLVTITTISPPACSQPPPPMSPLPHTCTRLPPTPALSHTHSCSSISRYFSLYST